MTPETDPRNWEYVTTQGGCEYYRTGFECNGWPVFAKRLAKCWRAYEACHRPLRFGSQTLDAQDRQALAELIRAMLPRIDNAALRSAGEEL